MDIRDCRLEGKVPVRANFGGKGIKTLYQKEGLLM